MKVKICGTTCVEDAALAVSQGADAVGFLVGLAHPSPDEISAEDARRIIATLPPFVASVLVTHRSDAAWIAATCRAIRCNTVQLHGPVAGDDIPALRLAIPEVKIIKTVHVESRGAIARAIADSRFCDAILVDTKTADRLGGTGKTHDWTISAEIARTVPVPLILAGGLTPENVRHAISVVRPFAVDVNSGVEDANGAKSAERVRAFILGARSA